MADVRSMAGDRGLALVIIGLIGVAVLWRTARVVSAEAERPNSPGGQFLVHAGQGSAAMVRPEDRRGDRMIEDLTRRMAADYRRFQKELQRLASMKDAVSGPAFSPESRELALDPVVPHIPHP